MIDIDFFMSHQIVSVCKLVQLKLIPIGFCKKKEVMRQHQDEIAKACETCPDIIKNNPYVCWNRLTEKQQKEVLENLYRRKFRS